MTAIPIHKESLLTALKDLEFLVVSLDRIGSAELTHEARAHVLYRFVVEGSVFQRLSSIRRLMSSTLDEGVSPAELHAIEASLECVCAWGDKAQA